MTQKATPARQRLYSLVDDFSPPRVIEQDNEGEYHEFLRRRVKECDEARASGEYYTTEQVTDMVNQWISESSG